MGYLFAALLGYLMGCSNMAYYIAKAKKADMRSAGSGNLGASNAVVLLGWKAGVATAVHDIGKATLAVLLARLLFPLIGLDKSSSLNPNFVNIVSMLD